MKFSALNVDFNSPSLDLPGSRKLHTRASKSGTPKSRYSIIVGKSTMKTVADNMDMLPITTSPDDELFSHTNVDDFERPELQK